MAETAPTDDNTGWQHSVYEQLHRLAQGALARESPGHSLQPTMLVNDAYVKLLEQRNVDPADRSRVMAAGATIIRRLLVDYARTRKAQKRGGPDGRGIPLHISVADSANLLDVLELNDALEALGDENERAAQVVELKFFGGLSGDEIAERLDVSLRTVNNDWRFAKAWLYRALGSEPEGRNDDD
jgi:RNA polymerase sigma factor (TIGR02999 family)